MNENKRQKNEIEFDSWLEKENGSRIYSFETSMCGSTQTEMSKTLKHMEASSPLKTNLY